MEKIIYFDKSTFIFINFVKYFQSRSSCICAGFCLDLSDTLQKLSFFISVILHVIKYFSESVNHFKLKLEIHEELNSSLGSSEKSQYFSRFLYCRVCMYAGLFPPSR